MKIGASIIFARRCNGCWNACRANRGGESAVGSLFWFVDDACTVPPVRLAARLRHAQRLHHHACPAMPHRHAAGSASLSNRENLDGGAGRAHRTVPTIALTIQMRRIERSETARLAPRIDVRREPGGIHVAKVRCSAWILRIRRTAFSAFCREIFTHTFRRPRCAMPIRLPERLFTRRVGSR